LRRSRSSFLFNIATAIVIAALHCTFSFGQTSESAVGPARVRKPLRYGIVVDNSGSMRMQLENMIELVKDIIDLNQPGDEAFLVRFISSDKVILVEELTSEKDAIYEAADGMFAEGGQTAILDAVSFSAKYLDEKTAAEASPAKALLLITDGDERGSATRIEQLTAQLKQSNIRVFAIGISDMKVETKTLDKLTKGTGGRTFLPKGQLERRAVAKTVSAAIREM
jgi:Ca-activated chloride channel homolog